jgi:hypothetical protein
VWIVVALAIDHMYQQQHPMATNPNVDLHAKKSV